MYVPRIKEEQNTLRFVSQLRPPSKLVVSGRMNTRHATAELQLREKLATSV